MATVWVRGGLIAWIKGAPETRRADTPLRGSHEEGDEPLYDQEAFDAAIAAEREACAAECERMMMYPFGRQESSAHNNVWAAAKAIRERSNAGVKR